MYGKLTKITNISGCFGRYVVSSGIVQKENGLNTLIDDRRHFSDYDDM